MREGDAEWNLAWYKDTPFNNRQLWTSPAPFRQRLRQVREVKQFGTTLQPLRPNRHRLAITNDIVSPQVPSASSCVSAKCCLAVSANQKGSFQWKFTAWFALVRIIFLRQASHSGTIDMLHRWPKLLLWLTSKGKYLKSKLEIFRTKHSGQS